jgi:Mg-chelatase subunit ChlD
MTFAWQNEWQQHRDQLSYIHFEQQQQNSNIILNKNNVISLPDCVSMNMMTWTEK